MGFLDQMAKAAALGMAVEMSKNKKGKPDPYKAAGIAAGMGYTALSDRASLGAMLGSEGAFDDVPPDDGYEDELAYGEAEDGMEDFTEKKGEGKTSCGMGSGKAAAAGGAKTGVGIRKER